MAEASFRKILAFLDSVIAGRMAVRRKEAGLVVAIAVLAVALLGPAAVALQPRFGYAAVGYLILSALIGAAALARAWWLLRRRPGRQTVALEIEAARPDLGSNLISSLQLFPRKGALDKDDPTSPALIDALVEETAAQAACLVPGGFVSSVEQRRLGRLATLMAVAAVLVGLVAPGVYPASFYLLANAPDLMPSRIVHLRLTADAQRVLPSMPVHFEVWTEGRIPEAVDIELAPLGQEKGEVRQMAMEPAGERHFRLSWSGVESDVRVVARTGRFRSPPLEIRVVEPPRVDGVEVVYFPPEYTGLKPSKGAESGHILSYLGTNVLVRAKVNKPMAEAVLSLADGWRIPLKAASESGIMEGLLILSGPGSYQVRLKDGFGFSNLAPERYRIDILPDVPPTLHVLGPDKDVIVDGDEQVEVRYEAHDDFGVRNVFMEVRVENGPVRKVKLWGGESPQRAAKGAYVFDLRSIGLRPGASLRYRLLAEDTDTVSGPKVTTSRFYQIRVRDRDAVMATLDQRLGEISERLLDLLGDHVEKDAPPPRVGIGRREDKRFEPRSGTERTKPPMSAKAGRILDDIRKSRAMLRPQNPRESLTSMDLKTLQRQLEDALNRFLRPAERLEARKQRGGAMSSDMRRMERQLAARQEETTEAFERMATMGEEIQRNLRMDSAGRTADSLLQRQRSLERSLEKMRKRGTANPEQMRRVEQEIARLQQELNKLMRQLSGLAQRMPAEFMNQRSMRDMPMQDMMKAFDRIREQMRKGDFRGALEALRQLMSQLQRMRAALRGIQRQQMMAQRGGAPIRRQQSELSSIVEEQQAILGETVSQLENVVDRLKKGWTKSLSALDKDLGRKIREERTRAAVLSATDCPKPGRVKAAETPSNQPQGGERPVGAVGKEGVLPVPEPAMEKEMDPREARVGVLNELEAAAKRGDWGTVFHRLPEWAAVLRKGACAENSPDEATAEQWVMFRRRLDALLRQAEKRAVPTEVSELDGLRFRQKALQERLANFTEKLRRLMQVFPFINPDILERIVDAGRSMEEAVASLIERSPSHAVPPEEEVIRKLAQGQSAMQQAMQQMAQRGSMGMGTPRGFGIYQRGPGGQWWSRNPDFPGQEGFRPRGREPEEGSLGTQFSEVPIPDRDQYQVPPEYREEVMEALKDGVPPALKGEIEDYFDRLTK